MHMMATQWYFSLPPTELLRLLVHKKRLCSWRGTSLEQQRLNSRRLVKKVPKRKDTPMSAEGLSHSLRWVRAKLADKQQSAQTSPHLNRSRSWTLHSAPIGGKGIVLNIA